jgi:hypothetical protein
MSKSALENPIFADAAKARNWLEKLLWNDGRVCGYCGVIDEATALPSRPGYYQCNAKGCRKQFTVQVGTVFERSHIPLNKWLMAAFLICSSKKGISAHQMHRMLGVTYKSAWFMMHRLREAMKAGNTPLGGEGMVIEADETYMGKRDGKPSKPDSFVSGFGWVKHPKIQTQRKIVALVERGGAVRSVVVNNVDKATIRKVLEKNADKRSVLMTDEAPVYGAIGAHFADHQTVNHGQFEYARAAVSTNTIEGVFSIFKRGMVGTYQHCSEAHLHRYLAEFDFRYSNRAALEIDDVQRTKNVLAGIVGKRLTYRRTNESRHA